MPPVMTNVVISPVYSPNRKRSRTRRSIWLVGKNIAEGRSVEERGQGLLTGFELVLGWCGGDHAWGQGGEEGEEDHEREAGHLFGLLGGVI